MLRHKLYLAVGVALGVVALAVTMAPMGSADDGDRQGGGRLISESELLSGLAANSLFPFVDTTPSVISRAHIAITDSTTTCAAGAAAPANIQVLVGRAGGTLTNVMTAATNTGIGTPSQCVFHVTVRPGRGGVLRPVTDVVVKNAGGAALTGIHTITVSANVNSGD